MTKSTDGLSSEVRETLVSRLEDAPVSLALLFGSQASGDIDAGSDVDIAIEYETDDVTDTHLSLVADVMRLLGRDDVDVVRLTTVDPRIAIEALDDGEILVGSEARASELRDRLDDDRRQREKQVQARVSSAERAIEKRLERREHG